MLTIYDDYHTVKLDTVEAGGSGVAIARRGYAQAISQPNAHGYYPDVIDKIKVRFLDPDDSDRAVFMASLSALGERSRAVNQAEHREYLNPAQQVFIKAQTPTETSVRYAIVRDIIIEKMDPAHYGRRPATAEIKVVREGLWRYSEPGTAATSLYDSHYINFRSVIQVNSSEIDGDAPGLGMVRIRRTADSVGTTAALCLIRGKDYSDLSDFDPFFWCEDADTPNNLVARSGYSLNSGAIVPDPVPVTTSYQELSDGISRNSVWTIDTNIYNGRFEVMAIYTQYDTTSPGDAVGTIYVSYGLVGQELAGETKDLLMTTYTVNSTQWSVVSLGHIKIPETREFIRGELAPPDDYEIAIQHVLTNSTGEGAVAGICLVPLDGDFMEIEIDKTPYRTVVDGEIQRVYEEEYSTGKVVYAYPAKGVFPRMIPGYHFAIMWLPREPYLLVPNELMDFDVLYWPRCRSIT